MTLIHDGRKCPNCGENNLPKGLVVSCQSCQAIVKYDHVIGNFVDGKAIYNPKGKYEKIKEYVEGLSPEELTALEGIIQEKKHG